MMAKGLPGVGEPSLNPSRGDADRRWPEMSVSDEVPAAEGAMAYLPFYYERFAWSTRGWPVEAAFAYLMLLCEQWASGSLEAEPALLEDLVPGTVAHWSRLKHKFPLCPDGRRRNRRCEEHRQQAIRRGERRRSAGRAGAMRRWNGNAMAMPCDRYGNENENENENEVNTNMPTQGAGTSEINVKGQPRPRVRPALPPGSIEALWALFPRRVGKKRAVALLERAVRDYAEEWELDSLEDAVAWMRERIEAMAKQYRNTEARFIPHPATWLGQGRYLDPDGGTA